MEYDCALLRAQIDSIRREPTLLSSPGMSTIGLLIKSSVINMFLLEFLLTPAVIVMRLAHANQQNQAMTIARSLKVDMTDLFIHLTNQCVRLTRNPGSILYARSIYSSYLCVNLSSRHEDTSGWLLTDSASSWQGSPSDRGWRYLQQALKRHDSVETDHRYAKASLETMLSADSMAPPPWLIDTLEVNADNLIILIENQTYHI